MTAASTSSNILLYCCFAYSFVFAIARPGTATFWGILTVGLWTSSDEGLATCRTSVRI